MANPAVKAQAMWAFEAQGLTIVEDYPPASIVRTRDATDDQLRAIGDALGVGWPLQPNTSAGGPQLRVCRLGPQEWAVIGRPHEEVAGLVPVGEILMHVADMSDAWTRWRITGVNAEKFLSRGCPLNLHPNAFAENAVSRTLLGHASIVLVRDDLGFAVYADAALSEYVRAWIAAATLATG